MKPSGHLSSLTMHLSHYARNNDLDGLTAYLRSDEPWRHLIGIEAAHRLSACVALVTAAEKCKLKGEPAPINYNKPWAPERIQTLKNLMAKYGRLAAARRMGISPDTARLAAKRYGIAPP